MKEKELPEDLFIKEGKIVEEILRKAAKDALLIHKKADNPIATWQNGKVVILSPEQIKIPS